MFLFVDVFAVEAMHAHEYAQESLIHVATISVFANASYFCLCGSHWQISDCNDCGMFAGLQMSQSVIISAGAQAGKSAFHSTNKQCPLHQESSLK